MIVNREKKLLLKDNSSRVIEEDTFADETLYTNSVDLFRDGSKPVKRNKTVLNGEQSVKQYEVLKINTQSSDVLLQHNISDEHFKQNPVMAPRLLQLNLKLNQQ